MNMNDNLCEVKEDILVVLDSRNATTIYNGNFNSDVEFDLTDRLAMPRLGVGFSVSVMNATIPIGQYNVNSTNNILVLKNIVTDVISTVTITPGNYTITQLIAELTTNTPAEYEYSYTAKINKMSLYNTTHNFQILSTTTMWELLGLQRNTVVTSIFKTYHFPNCVNMSGLRNINIHLDNLTTKNIASSTKSVSTIIGNIPVDVNGSGVLSWNLSNNYEIPVPILSLDYINILLKDNENNLLEMNGIHWNITLRFSYYLRHDFTMETLSENVNKNRQKIKIVQPQIMNMEIPQIFRSKEDNSQTAKIK
jgi:hypothetical protein